MPLKKKVKALLRNKTTYKTHWVEFELSLEEENNWPKLINNYVESAYPEYTVIGLQEGLFDGF